jgi:hypothetical protein
LSVEAFQWTVSEELVAEPTVTPAGTDGGVVSPPPPPPPPPASQEAPLSLQLAGVADPEFTQPNVADAPGARLPL